MRRRFALLGPLLLLAGGCGDADRVAQTTAPALAEMAFLAALAPRTG